jgi:hypothetical protein
VSEQSADAWAELHAATPAGWFADERIKPIPVAA